MDLTEIVREVLSRFSEESARASCSFEIHAEGPVVGIWDRIRIEQLVTNLVANALKYGRGKPVLVSVEGGAASAVLTVRDHGPGFPAGELDKVFDRFWRADEARATPGSGLGLAIVQRVAEEHEGRARACNAGGGGAVVSLELAEVQEAS